MARGRRVRAGLYQYEDRPSGLVWYVIYEDQWRYPEWTYYIEPIYGSETGFADVTAPTKREMVEVVEDWIDKIYNELNGLTADEVREYRDDPYNDAFRYSLSHVVYEYMTGNDIEVFSERDFR